MTSKQTNSNSCAHQSHAVCFQCRLQKIEENIERLFATLRLGSVNDCENCAGQGFIWGLSEHLNTIFKNLDEPVEGKRYKCAECGGTGFNFKLDKLEPYEIKRIENVGDCGG